MPTRNIHLTDHFDQFIEGEVRSGRYGGESEVVREGLWFLERRNREERARLEWLRDAVSSGLEQIDRGERIEFRSIYELEEEIDSVVQFST